MIKVRKSSFFHKPHFDKPIIFCFHHAGGNARTYQKWLSNNKVDFVPIELPGHGAYINEPLLKNIDELSVKIADEIAEVIALKRNIQFSVFGHSLGAIIAFSVTDILNKKYMISPNCLQIAGRHAPQKEDPSSYHTNMGKQALIEEIMQYGYTPIELIENEEYRDFILPILFNDYKLSESFKYHGQKLSIPILAYYGNDDIGADRNIMRYWEYVTTNIFHIKGFNGGHFFLLDNENDFSNVLADDMLSFTKNHKTGNPQTVKTIHYERWVI